MKTKCDKDHSGNHQLHLTAGGWMQCAGCGEFYGEAPRGKSLEEMLLPQPKPIAQPKPITIPTDEHRA